MLKTKLQKIPALLLALFIILALSLPVFAATPATFVATAPGSISLTLRDSETKTPAAGVRFALYRVASIKMDDGNLSYVYTSDFETCGVTLDNIGSENLANHLAAFAETKALKPLTTGSTDQNGYVHFSGLPLGLYLLLQTNADSSDYLVSPFLVSVPTQDGDKWVYDVDASPKTEARRKPETPEKTQIAVRKVWQDGSNANPGSASFALMRNGSIFASVTLNESNGWLYAWDNLDASYSWDIAEINVPSGYTATYSESGAILTATNTGTHYIPPTTPPTGGTTTPGTPTTTIPGGNIPTGGPSDQLYKTGQTIWPIPVLAGAGMLLFAVGWVIVAKRKDGRE
jgi:hypothetical protein